MTDITLKVESLFTASLHLSNFVQTQNEAKILTLSFIPTENQLADILTKPLNGSWFESLRKAISVCDMS
jgi:hypothetical protein